MYNFMAKEIDYANYFQTVSQICHQIGKLFCFLSFGVRVHLHQQH